MNLWSCAATTASRCSLAVLVARQPEDTGPFYRLYPEGRIANFDGRTIPDAHFLSDNGLRLQPQLPLPLGA